MVVPFVKARKTPTEYYLPSCLGKGDMPAMRSEQFDTFSPLLSDGSRQTEGNAMITFNSKTQPQARQFVLTVCLALLTGSAVAKVPLAAKWGRFEQSFKSATKYENPFQQCALKVTFTSPLKDTYVVDGFWDGGRTWRVSFSPDQPGRWTYRTSCSDSANRGLENQSGEFLCTSPTGQGRFAQHGPIRVAKDGHHFEHADGLPFFWMADVAWNAPRLSGSKDWITYTQVRSGQNFSAVQWSANAAPNAKKHSAFSGQDRIAIDPEYFQFLDEKIDMMNRAGLLSVIAPFWEDNAIQNLPDEQLTRLVRYMNARWSAYDVAWLLAANENHDARWLKIGREIFGTRPHAPVILFTGPLGSKVNNVRNEQWIDAFGFALDKDSGSLESPAHESETESARPFLNVLPPMENSLSADGRERITDHDIRRVAWWSLLLTPPAGVSYGAQDVATWNTAKQGKLPIWQLSLFLPGAKQMSHIVETYSSADSWTLRPAPRAVAIQPGRNAPQRFIASASNAAHTLSLTYVPEDRNLEILLDALPGSPEIQWLNPRTGKKTAAVAVVGVRTCQLPTPDAGDWVLCVKSGK